MAQKGEQHAQSPLENCPYICVEGRGNEVKEGGVGRVRVLRMEEEEEEVKKRERNGKKRSVRRGGEG